MASGPFERLEAKKRSEAKKRRFPILMRGTLEVAVHTCLQTPFEGSLALAYKDQVRTGPDTPLPRTRRVAVVLFVCPQLDRFTS
jgi:transposase